jgi:hypothetical protein
VAINLEKTILAEFDRYLRCTDNERHKAMIWNYREHVRCEETGRIDELVALLAEDAEYRVMGPGAPVMVQGRDAIREHYQSLTPHDLIDLRLAHLMVTDWGVSGQLDTVVSTTPELLRFAGFPAAGEDGTYEMRMSAAFFRPFAGDLASGITYFGGHPQVKKIGAASPGELSSGTPTSS